MRVAENGLECLPRRGGIVVPVARSSPGEQEIGALGKIPSVKVIHKGKQKVRKTNL
jgi:hypothetical protein